MQEFSISDSISSNRAKPEPQALNPFAAPKEPERNPEDPLALLSKNDPPPRRVPSTRTNCLTTNRCSKTTAFSPMSRRQRWCRP
jgi:hypothetical protein